VGKRRLPLRCMMSLLHGPLGGEESVRKRAWVLVLAMGPSSWREGQGRLANAT
jgi:hypothetical protein